MTFLTAPGQSAQSLRAACLRGIAGAREGEACAPEHASPSRAQDDIAGFGRENTLSRWFDTYRGLSESGVAIGEGGVRMSKGS